MQVGLFWVVNGRSGQNAGDWAPNLREIRKRGSGDRLGQNLLLGHFSPLSAFILSSGDGSTIFKQTE
jgi:hypothetical protein